MNFVESLRMFHVDAKEIPCVTGKGAPTEKTLGAPGVLYMDTDTGDLYKCRAADAVNKVYTWEKIGGGSSDYKLPIGGAQLGGVKNGGNVVINEDGTMTAPEAGSIKITGTENSKIAPTGTILDNGTEIHLVSQEIRVNPGEQYLLTCSANFGNSLYAIYESNGAKKENLEAPATEEGRSAVDLPVTIPSDGAILRVAWNKDVTDTPYAVTKVGNAVVIPKSLDGVTVAVIGDSLVERNNSAKVNFVDLIAAETGATVTNLGVGGTGYMAGADESKAFYQRAAQIPEGTDRVLIYGSGNDRNMPLGNPTDTGTDTLCGCINATIDAVYERVPTAWVGIIAPAPWKEYPPYGEKKQLELMVQAQQRICARRGIPFLDLYHASGLRPWDDTFRELAFDEYGVHPNDTGHALIAPQIQAFLLGAIGGGAVASVPDSSQNVDLTGYAKEQWVQEGFQPKGEYLTEVPEGYAKTEDIPTKPEDIGAQPKGDYLTAVPAGYATEEFVKNKIAEAELGGEEVDLSGYAQKSELPTKVSQLENDKGYLTEHQDISGKLDSSALPTAINTALAQAKASGEFDGEDGFSPVVTVENDVLIEGYMPTTGIRITVQNKDSTQEAQLRHGKDGQNGTNGKDGTSATHSWNGTVLTVTSASGTSSADLKGAKGDKGDSIKGDKGDKGDTGATGSAGKDGTSVTVKSVSESTEDGGSNVVTFSDGKTVTIKNGSKGSTGAAGKDGADGKDYSFDPTVYGLPVLYLTGDTTDMNKDNAVTLSYAYGENSGSCTLKWQGSSSLAWDKKNYTFKADNAFEVVDGWGAQKKYCLKANWIDHSHSRNVVSAKLWGLVRKSRSNLNSKLKNLPNAGAIDGFPVIIMLNGEFHGLYSFNIPKDAWMFGMGSGTKEAIVGADNQADDTAFKAETLLDADGWELEYSSDSFGADAVKASLNNLIKACMDSWGGDLDTTVAQYLDWESAIDYYIFATVLQGGDMITKNTILATFDGVKWYFSAYDMDTTYGLEFDGSKLNRAVTTTHTTFKTIADTHRVFELIYRFKTNELKARYNALRTNELSESRICNYFENYAWDISSPILVEEVKKWPSVRGSSVNGIDQICRWVRQRLEKCDEWINALPAQEIPVEPEPDEPSEVFTNLVPTSTDVDGSVYNGTGYKDNARLSSTGGVSSSAQNGSVVTGFIPFKNTDVIRMKGATWAHRNGEHYYFSLYSSNKTLISKGYTSAEAWTGDAAYQTQLQVTYDATTGVTTFQIIDPTSNTGDFRVAAQNAAYFRINAYGKGADLIVTVNQEITE